MTEPKNVALHKKVNAKGANASAITDGEKDRSLHWDGGVAPAKATIDLKGYFSISSIRLTTYYGDYMQLPPPEKRVCKQHAILIDVEHSPVLELTDDEKIDIVAARILNRFRPAFEELAK